MEFCWFGVLKCEFRKLYEGFPEEIEGGWLKREGLRRRCSVGEMLLCGKMEVESGLREYCWLH